MILKKRKKTFCPSPYLKSKPTHQKIQHNQRISNFVWESKPQKALLFYHSKTLILEEEKNLKNTDTDRHRHGFTNSKPGVPNVRGEVPEGWHGSDDLVKNIADMGAYVSLLEYNNIEGMILFSELSRRQIWSISSLIKVGRIEPVMVLRVNKEKGYIDLSKRRVSEEDIQACKERYNKSKLDSSIFFFCFFNISFYYYLIFF